MMMSNYQRALEREECAQFFRNMRKIEAKLTKREKNFWQGVRHHFQNKRFLSFGQKIALQGIIDRYAAK